MRDTAKGTGWLSATMLSATALAVGVATAAPAVASIPPRHEWPVQLEVVRSPGLPPPSIAAADPALPSIGGRFRLGLGEARRGLFAGVRIPQLDALQLPRLEGVYLPAAGSRAVEVRNRYYDPELGRFITTDPLGYVDGPSLYQYGLNSPLDHSDPMGLRNWEIEYLHRTEEAQSERAEARAEYLAIGPTISAIEGSASRGALYFAVDQFTAGLLSDEEAYVNPLYGAGQAPADLRAFEHRFGAVASTLDAVTALRSPSKLVKLGGIALAAVTFLDAIDKPFEVTVTEGRTQRTVQYDPNLRGSKFRDPNTGRIVKTPELFRQIPDHELRTGTLDLTGDVEELRRVQEFLDEVEKSQNAANPLDAAFEVVRGVARRFKKR